MHPLTVHELTRLQLAEQLDHARRSGYRAPPRPRTSVRARLGAWFEGARRASELRPTGALRRRTA